MEERPLHVEGCTGYAVRQASSGASSGGGRSTSGDAECSHSLASGVDDVPNQAAHHGIAVSDQRRIVCDAATISNYVALVPLGNRRATKIIPVGAAPAEALTSLDGRYCFVISRGPTGLNRPHVKGNNGDTLSVISYAEMREIARVRVGIHPQAETEIRVRDSVLRAGGFLR